MQNNYKEEENRIDESAENDVENQASPQDLGLNKSQKIVAIFLAVLLYSGRSLNSFVRRRTSCLLAWTSPTLTSLDFLPRPLPDLTLSLYRSIISM